MSEKREPLTLNQLREMDGKPVKVVYDEAAKKTTPGFEPLEMICLVEYVKSAGCVVLRNNVGGESEYCNDEELEQDGLTAYPYHPPRLDRSAWEPCEFCGEWIGGECTPKEQDAGYTLYAGYSKQVAVDDFWEDEIEDVQYCPKCGRPLTEEAWKELEQRLER